MLMEVFLVVKQNIVSLLVPDKMKAFKLLPESWKLLESCLETFQINRDVVSAVSITEIVLEKF